MNIYSAGLLTPYTYHQQKAQNTWTGATSTDYQGFGVWKPRGTSSLPNESPNQTGEPTLNIKVKEQFINRKNPQAMEGDTVTVPSVGGRTYRVTGVTTAVNYRTRRVDHYRLILQEIAE